MTDPFQRGPARVIVNGKDLEATDVKVDSTPVIFDTSASGLRRQMESQIARSIKPTIVQVELSFQLDSRRLTRQLKGMEAKIGQLDKPLSIPSAQEIVMRQELGEFDA